MRLLGWIPARGSSKGIPAKNKRMLGNKPLIVHTIAAARAAGCFDRILVSTDDREIARLAIEAGVEVPWMRPPELAGDESEVIDALLHDLSALQTECRYRPEAVIGLQPTSPFRSAETIRSAAAMLASGPSVVSVSPVRDHPYWCRRVAEDGTLLPFLSDIDRAVRRQDLPPAYVLNGAIYAAPVDTIMSHRTFCMPDTRALIISDESESLDIDTELDWLVAEALWRQTLRGKPA